MVRPMRNGRRPSVAPTRWPSDGFSLAARRVEAEGGGEVEFCQIHSLPPPTHQQKGVRDNEQTTATLAENTTLQGSHKRRDNSKDTTLPYPTIPQTRPQYIIRRRGPEIRGHQTPKDWGLRFV